MPGKHYCAWSPHGQQGDSQGQVIPDLLDLKLSAHKRSNLLSTYFGLGSVLDAFIYYCEFIDSSQ